MNRQQCFKILNIYKIFKEIRKIRSTYVQALGMPVIDMPLDKKDSQQFVNVVLPTIEEMAIKEKEIIKKINQIPSKDNINELEGASVVAKTIKYLAEQIIVDLKLFEKGIKGYNDMDNNFINNLKLCSPLEYSIFFEIYISILEINILNDVLNDDYFYKILKNTTDKKANNKIQELISYIKTLFTTAEDYRVIQLFLENFLSENEKANKLLKKELKIYAY